MAIAKIEANLTKLKKKTCCWLQPLPQSPPLAPTSGHATAAAARQQNRLFFNKMEERTEVKSDVLLLENMS